jgi:predicted O-methyltransferase YrrM
MKIVITHDVIDCGAFTWVNGVKGCLREVDAKILINASRSMPFDGKYVEVGSWLGCSSILVALHSPARCKVYCHDLWSKDFPKGSNPPPDEDNIGFQFHKNVMDNNLDDIITPVCGDSSTMLGIHADASIDMAFIDGDHSYDGITKDLEAIFPKMTPQSVILCHDCNTGTDALRGLVDFCNTHGLEDVRGFDGTDMKMIVL